MAGRVKYISGNESFYFIIYLEMETEEKTIADFLLPLNVEKILMICIDF